MMTKSEEKVVDVGDDVLIRTTSYWKADDDSVASNNRGIVPLLVLNHSTTETFIDKLLLGPDYININNSSSDNNNNNNNNILCADFIVEYKFPDTVMEESFILKRKNNYDIATLANDAIIVMKEGYGYDKFHVIGCPILCGIITQYLIIHHSSHIISATIVSSSTTTPVLFSNDDKRFFRNSPEQLFFQNNTYHKKKVEEYAIAELDGDKDGIAQFDAYMGLIRIAVSYSNRRNRRPQLRLCNTPTLIIHGSGGEALLAEAKAIPGAELMTIDQDGTATTTHDDGGFINNPSHVDAIIVRILTLLYDCCTTNNESDLHCCRTPLQSNKKPILRPEYSTQYSDFLLDMQTLTNGMDSDGGGDGESEWITNNEDNNSIGSIISSST
jgi:hypothetical protein